MGAASLHLYLRDPQQLLVGIALAALFAALVLFALAATLSGGGTVGALVAEMSQVTPFRWS
jgi:hypothetical protein